MKPLIGITTYLVSACEMNQNRVRGRIDQDMVMTTLDYQTSVVDAGGLPVLIAPILDDSYLEGMIDRIDGLILSGGCDMDPSYYHQSMKPGLGKISPIRDAVELKLLTLALKKQIPVFGICRGLQVMNVYFGGTLIQDINQTEISTVEHVCRNIPKNYPVHQVSLSKHLDLISCFEENRIGVNSLHHQCIDELADPLMICGTSEDGIIEAICLKDNHQVFAVQWHPEMMSEHLNVFRLLVNYSKNEKNH